MKNNNVSINLKTDKIIIKIADEAKQEDIVDELSKKLIDLKKLYKDETLPIKIVGKLLKNKDADEIQKIIKNFIDVDVKFEVPRGMGLSSIEKTFKKDIGMSDTKFHRGSLRSGQRIEVEGSAVILGDVNSGAEVIASDNIVILGTLRGLAHAGAKGNEKAIISAEKIDTVQIRIANVVKEINRDEEPLHNESYVYVHEKSIVIEQL